MSTLVVSTTSIQASRRPRVLMTEFENGSEQRRRKGQNPVTSWDITTTPLNATDAGALETFYLTTVRGEADSFTWVHTDTGTSYNVRFDGDLKDSRAGKTPGRTTYTFRLKVVY